LDVLSSILSVACYEGLVFGLIAIGVYITFRILAFPDLSVDGTFPLGGAIAAVLIVSGVNPFVATLAAFAGGMLSGLITGLLNTKLRISALLSGIIMMVGLYSVNLRIMSGANIPLLREVTSFDVVEGLLSFTGGLVVSIIVVAVVVIIFLLALNGFLRTEIGLALRATGDNEEMVRGLGVDTDKTVLLGCSISNGLVALSGSLVAQNQGFSDVGMGIGMIVLGLAAVIIGEGLFHPKGIASILLACLGGTFVYRLFITVPYVQKRMRKVWLPPAKRW